MKLSVVIPAYNHGRFLGQCLGSVLSQDLPDFEVIVVDDGSTDNTRAVMASFRDPRVRYSYQENRGSPAARNTGYRLSTGEYIALLDSDDLLLPHSLEVYEKNWLFILDGLFREVGEDRGWQELKGTSYFYLYRGLAGYAYKRDTKNLRRY